MKMVMLVYNEAVDDDIMDVMRNCGVTNYTKVTGAFGKGTTSGTHMGDDIWPGLNNILYCVAPEKEASQFMDCIRQAKKRLGTEGVKAFLFPVEDVT